MGCLGLVVCVVHRFLNGKFVKLCKFLKKRKVMEIFFYGKLRELYYRSPDLNRVIVRCLVESDRTTCPVFKK